MAESVTLVGIKETLAILKNVEPEAYKQLNKDIERIVQPAKSQIVKTTPFLAPLSGMMGNGRTAYTGVRVKTSKSLTARSGSRLIQLRAEGFPGAGFEIADMAGRGSGRGRRPKSVTRAYPYKGGTRTHRLNGQGQAMIRNLPSKASRFTYPAVEKMMPQIQADVFKSLEVAAAVINRKLNVL